MTLHRTWLAALNVEIEEGRTVVRAVLPHFLCNFMNIDPYGRVSQYIHEKNVRYKTARLDRQYIGEAEINLQ